VDIEMTANHALHVFRHALQAGEDPRQAVRDHLAEKGDHPTRQELDSYMLRLAHEAWVELQAEIKQRKDENGKRTK